MRSYSYRRAIFLMAAVVMALALAPCITGNVARAADSDFTVVNGVITAYNGSDTEQFSIPAMINGEMITGVADGVFTAMRRAWSVLYPPG